MRDPSVDSVQVGIDLSPEGTDPGLTLDRLSSLGPHHKELLASQRRK